MRVYRLYTPETRSCIHEQRKSSLPRCWVVWPLPRAASAQEFDDRRYLTGSAGFNFQDGDRTTNDAPFVLLLGLGKFVSPNWSIDGELNYREPELRRQPGFELEPVRHLVRPASPLRAGRPRAGTRYLLFGNGLPEDWRKNATPSGTELPGRAQGRRVRRQGRVSACRPPSTSAPASPLTIAEFVLVVCGAP